MQKKLLSKWMLLVRINDVGNTQDPSLADTEAWASDVISITVAMETSIYPRQMTDTKLPVAMNHPNL